jgi:hypothetical protein
MRQVEAADRFGDFGEEITEVRTYFDRDGLHQPVYTITRRVV